MASNSLTCDINETPKGSLNRLSTTGETPKRKRSTVETPRGSKQKLSPHDSNDRRLSRKKSSSVPPGSPRRSMMLRSPSISPRKRKRKGSSLPPPRSSHLLVKTLKCEEHGLPAEQMCVDCHLQVCFQCIITQHDKHRLEDLQPYVEKFLNKLYTVHTKLEERRKFLENVLTGINAFQKRIQSAHNKLDKGLFLMSDDILQSCLPDMEPLLGGSGTFIAKHNESNIVDLVIEDSDMLPEDQEKVLEVIRNALKNNGKVRRAISTGYLERFSKEDTAEMVRFIRAGITKKLSEWDYNVIVGESMKWSSLAFKAVRTFMHCTALNLRIVLFRGSRMEILGQSSIPPVPSNIYNMASQQASNILNITNYNPSTAFSITPETSNIFITSCQSDHQPPLPLDISTQDIKVETSTTFNVINNDFS